MRTVSIRLEDLCRGEIGIGYVGENLHTRVIIDAAKMYGQYPGAAASLTVKPPFGEAYPAVITRQGDSVVWDVTDSDLTRQGNGEIQLAFTVDETVAKTYIGKIRIGRSIIPTGEIPDPLDDFLTRAGAALTAIPETIDAALQEAKDSGEFDGADGYSPTATVTKSGKVATISITDKDGTTTAEVRDGEDGTPGATDYNDLTNKPSIAGVTLAGNKSLDDLGAAAKADTVLSSTLSHGRANNSTVGADSIAYGTYVTASGAQSQAFGSGSTASGTQAHAEGAGTTASGNYSHSEGGGTTASANQAHAEGGGTTASGESAHSEGGATVASGKNAHAEGTSTIAKHYSQHAGGTFNVPDPSDAASTSSGTYIEIIGNGSANARSNARTLDWVGNERLRGDLYVECNNDSTGGKKVATVNDIPDPADLIDDTAGSGDTDKVWSADKSSSEKSSVMSALNAITHTEYSSSSTYAVGDLCWHENAMYRCNTAISTAEEWTTAHWTQIAFPRDVRVNGTTVVDANGVANVPIAGTNAGVVKVSGTSFGLFVDTDTIKTIPASANQIKAGTDVYKQVAPYRQHEATFYGLAKVAGADMASSSNPVGTFTDAAKVAIQKMLGIYEAPWELIREDTGTNATEADVEIAVDGNGNSFELTDFVVQFDLPKNDDPSSIGNYGTVYAYFNSTDKFSVFMGAKTRTGGANAQIGYAIFRQENNNMIFSEAVAMNTQGTMANVQRYASAVATLSSPYYLANSQLDFKKVVISAVTGKWHYKLFGKRKWTA